ncbi:unnamed protein product [Cladocopium goreaui]|uniref:Uncharacterized protein n=1 Tax=Cladocopium goreaui TaxID=2562237 RepID=A0A9P1G8Z7_9DINO|nr:unnamed protein product [Cladocopium goreaui]
MVLKDQAVCGLPNASKDPGEPCCKVTKDVNCEGDQVEMLGATSSGWPEANLRAGGDGEGALFRSGGPYWENYFKAEVTMDGSNSLMESIEKQSQRHHCKVLFQAYRDVHRFA